MEKIYVNQVGYRPNDIKKAILPFEADSFTVNNSEGKTVFQGNVSHFGFDKASGDDVYVADFTSLSKPGKYKINVGEKTSDSFEIGEKVYNKLYRDIIRAYYYLRCGTELDKEHAGRFTHAACHTNTACEWENHSVEKDVCGGWHDAGDYGRYVTPGAVALGHLLYAYILYPKAVKSLKLNIPNESGIPDYLEECKYELDWLLKMQKKDGSVYHKATTARHAAFVMPEYDTEQMYLLPVSSIATADFAAVCALAFRVYKPFLPDYANTLLNAAEKSADWLSCNSEFTGFSNPEGCSTGGYGEGDDKDNRFWAYCELYAATGYKGYHDKLISLLAYDFPRTELGVGSVGGFGSLAYMTCNCKTKDNELVAAFKNMYIKKAEFLCWMSGRSGYLCSMDERAYGWGSNMGLMKNAMILAIADTICKSNSFNECAKAQLDVLLGVNAAGISYVTGNGDSAYNNPHLRPAFADGIDECMPGMVSGGPNFHPVEKNVRRFIPEGTPPMKCFADRMELYSVNEITIYWNSPVGFVLAYLLQRDDTEQRIYPDF